MRPLRPFSSTAAREASNTALDSGNMYAPASVPTTSDGSNPGSTRLMYRIVPCGSTSTTNPGSVSRILQSHEAFNSKVIAPPRSRACIQCTAAALPGSSPRHGGAVDKVGRRHRHGKKVPQNLLSREVRNVNAFVAYQKGKERFNRAHGSAAFAQLPWYSLLCFHFLTCLLKTSLEDLQR